MDVAVIVPPLAFAIELGLRGTPQRLAIPTSISLGGNTITLSRGLANQVREASDRGGLSVPQALKSVLDQQEVRPLPIGIVHAYSTHNLLLRYWLATGGIDPTQDVKLIVVPPARAAEALGAGKIAGFCAGAPWGDIAARAGAGSTIATSKDVWRNAPEKVFAVRTGWSDKSPDAMRGAVRALLRAGQFCDAPENASYTASLLSRQKYLDVDSHAILSSLPGGAIKRDNVSTFYANAATFPWVSHALWFLREMARWGLIEPGLDLPELAARVYRPDIYRAAVAPMGLAVPLKDKNIVSAPTFVKSGGQTVIDTGAWIARDTLDRCGVTVERSALLRAISGANQLSPSALFPGDFRGDIALGKDTARIVIPSIMATAKCADMQSGYIIDIVAKGDRTEAGWDERWTSSACGKIVYTDVGYRRENGLIVISAGPAATP